MALNPNTIKALFGKLAPYADDVVKGVANYGDDALALVADKGDDVARAVANYGDDALAVVDKVDDFIPDRTFEFTNPFGQVVSADYNKPGVWNIDGKTFHDIPEPYALTNQNALKEELLNKRTGREYLNSVPREGYDVKFLGDATPHFDYNNRETFNRGDGFTTTLPYHMPSEDLVYDRSTLRPHKNTALGRWYDNKVRDAQSLEMSDPGIDYGALRAQWDADSEEVTKFLDTEDMLGRVRAAASGLSDGISTQDALSYVNELPKLSTAPHNELKYLYDTLDRRYASSKTYQKLFGRAPAGVYPDNGTFDSALGTLKAAMDKLPF